GRCFTFCDGGYSPRKLSPFQLVLGRMGRGANPPPQLGHTSCSTVRTHVWQNVHSKLQIIASVEAGGSGVLQCSQVGLNSSMSDSRLGHGAIGAERPSRAAGADRKSTRLNSSHEWSS